MSSFYPPAPPSFSSTSPPKSSPSDTSPIVHLNVGGTRFTTSRQTLVSSSLGGHAHSMGGASSLSTSDSFFTALLSGRIGCLKDDSGAIFIDRDPDLFKVILNYLRTRTLSLKDVDIKQLLHEAEFYGIQPLVKQLTLCSDLDQSGCGDVLFYTYLAPPLIPSHEQKKTRPIAPPRASHSRNASTDSLRGNVPPPTRGHSRNNSIDTRPNRPPPPPAATHSRNSSADLSKNLRPASESAMGLVFGAHSGGGGGVGWVDPLRVQIVQAHQNCIAVAFPHFVACFKQKENNGFQPIFTSPYFEYFVERVAINAKMGNVLPQASGGEQVSTLTLKFFTFN